MRITSRVSVLGLVKFFSADGLLRDDLRILNYVLTLLVFK